MNDNFYQKLVLQLCTICIKKSLMIYIFLSSLQHPCLISKCAQVLLMTMKCYVNTALLISCHISTHKFSRLHWGNHIFLPQCKEIIDVCSLTEYLSLSQFLLQWYVAGRLPNISTHIFWDGLTPDDPPPPCQHFCTLALNMICVNKFINVPSCLKILGNFFTEGNHDTCCSIKFLVCYTVQVKCYV